MGDNSWDKAQLVLAKAMFCPQGAKLSHCKIPELQERTFPIQEDQHVRAAKIPKPALPSPRNDHAPQNDPISQADHHIARSCTIQDRVVCWSWFRSRTNILTRQGLHNKARKWHSQRRDLESSKGTPKSCGGKWVPAGEGQCGTSCENRCGFWDRGRGFVNKNRNRQTEDRQSSLGGDQNWTVMGAIWRRSNGWCSPLIQRLRFDRISLIWERWRRRRRMW